MKSPEFEIFKISNNDKQLKDIFRKKDYQIVFNNKDSYLILDLSKKEWNSLIKFLKSSMSKNCLPNDQDCYAGFAFIDEKGQYSFDNSKQHVKYYEELTKQSDDLLKKKSDKEFEWIRQMNLKRAKKESQMAEKFLIKNGIFFRKNEFFIHLDRNKFFRFREYCLNSENVRLN